MKIFITLILICTSIIGFSQKYALMDSKLSIPIIYSDSITVEQVKRGFFPFENKNIDTLIGNLLFLKEMLETRQRAKMESFELHFNNTIIKTSRIPYAYGDRYNSIAESNCDGVIATFNILSHKISNKKNAIKINEILEYFKSNKSFFSYPFEVHPKIYNVIVITQ